MKKRMLPFLFILILSLVPIKSYGSDIEEIDNPDIYLSDQSLECKGFGIESSEHNNESILVLHYLYTNSSKCSFKQNSAIFNSSFIFDNLFVFTFILF